jgi:glycosyltransferase involved in cell wall biosynthesis
LQKGEDNDATHEYIGIIKNAIIKEFGVMDIPITYTARDIKDNDTPIMISAKSFLFNKTFLKPKQKFLFWFQGVAPEEISFLYRGPYAKLKSFLFSHSECYILRNAQLLFFVSEQLHLHYQKKYGYHKDNYVIMPCFNQQLNESYFTAAKYEKPTFVYAGNMSKWQCPDEMVQLFTEIKKNIPEATLTILTADQDVARSILSKHSTEAEIKYVPLKDLSNELSKYKYGFLLREEMIINKVSTPTKMSSYMAAGIIPIFSDVIGDFKEIFKSLKHIVICKNNDSLRIVNHILEVERRPVDVKDILNEYRSVFETYYNREQYETLIADKLRFFLKDG